MKEFKDLMSKIYFLAKRLIKNSQVETHDTCESIYGSELVEDS
jgi:hypothetical protein